MIRTYIPDKTKRFIRWAQRDTCLLCKFPLVLYCHLHHVISVEDFGPEDEFNLIGLCANHHGMIENLKRTKFPATNKLGTNDIKVREWVYKIDAAKSILDNLNGELKQLVNLLLAPYPNSSGEVMSEVFSHSGPRGKIAIARMLIDKNIKIFKKVNALRPRIFFHKPVLKKVITDFDPYDLTLLNDNELQDNIDLVVNSAIGKVSQDVYDFAISQQFIKLGFGHNFDNEDNLIIIFSQKHSYSIKHIREMSDEECYSLKDE